MNFLFCLLGIPNTTPFLAIPKKDQRNRHHGFLPYYVEYVVRKGEKESLTLSAITLDEFDGNYLIEATNPSLIAILPPDLDGHSLDFNELTNMTQDMKWSSPEFRGRIGLSYNNARASYQGEFPSFMLRVGGVSVSDLSPLMCSDADNFLVFQSYYLGGPGRGYLIDGCEESVLAHIQILDGSTVVDLNPYVDIRELVFVSKGRLGIPIVTTLSGDSISIEHTQPPHSFVLGEQAALIKRYKNRYVSIIERIN